MNFALAHMPLPLRFRPSQPMDDADLMRFCAANDTLRVEREPNGEILIMTPAGVRTGRRNTNLVTDLTIWARQDKRGFVVESNTGFTLPDGSMRSPDAAWIDNARWDALSADDQDRYSPLCPDFIVELRSPSDSLPDLEKKMQQWMQNGVQLAWLIDPLQKVVLIYRNASAPETLHQPSLVEGDGILQGFQLSMEQIWA